LAAFDEAAVRLKKTEAFREGEDARKLRRDR
jgi:hypothetical protein